MEKSIANKRVSHGVVLCDLTLSLGLAPFSSKEKGACIIDASCNETSISPCPTVEAGSYSEGDEWVRADSFYLFVSPDFVSKSSHSNTGTR